MSGIRPLLLLACTLAHTGAASASSALPVFFEANRGQAANARFIGRASGYSVLLRPSHASYRTGGCTLDMSWLGANDSPRITGEEQTAGRSNYFLGSDPTAWLREIEQFERVRYTHVYPGIDLVFYDRDGRLEYDFIVEPDADPDQIVLGFSGMTSLTLDDAGALVFGLGTANLRQLRPTVYQEADGRQKRIAASYVIDGNRVRFALGAYDRTRRLFIDPEVSVTTQFGGADGTVESFASDIDAQGDIYLTGATAQTSFPTTGGSVQPGIGGGTDAYILKVSPDGQDIIWASYLGGAETDSIQALAVDATGRPVVAGVTRSADFPVSGTADQMDYRGVGDGFVARLSADGSTLTYSTFIGGATADGATAVDLDAAGNIYVTGQATSLDFELTPGALTPGAGVGVQIFLRKYGPAGARVYSARFGGTGARPNAIAARSDGTVWIAGLTNSASFPTTAGALQPASGGNQDGFLTWVNATGDGIIYSTHLGGSDLDNAFYVDADDFGTVYVSGVTLSPDFPTGTGGGTFPGERPAFISTFLFDDAAKNAGVTADTAKGQGALGHFRSIFWGSSDAFAQLFSIDALLDAGRRSQGAIAVGLWNFGEGDAAGDFFGGPCTRDSGIAVRVDTAGELVGGGCAPGVTLTGVGYRPAYGAHLSGNTAGETSIVLVRLPEFLRQASGGEQITGVLDAAGAQTLISPGAIISVYGDFVDATVIGNSIPLSTSLGGLSVTFNDVPGALFGVFDGAFDQANVQAPWNIDVGSGKVSVKIHSQGAKGATVSEPFEADAALASPGIYMYPPGTTQGIVTNFKLNEDDGVIAGSWAQPTGSVDPAEGQPAAIGGVITIWCNGLGPVTPVPATGDIPPPGTVPLPDKTIRVFVGGVEAQVLGSALQPQNVGLNQINIIIPEGVAPGDAVPIVIEVDCGDGKVFRSREDVTIAVRAAP